MIVSNSQSYLYNGRKIYKINVFKFSMQLCKYTSIIVFVSAFYDKNTEHKWLKKLIYQKIKNVIALYLRV